MPAISLMPATLAMPWRSERKECGRSDVAERLGGEVNLAIGSFDALEPRNQEHVFRARFHYRSGHDGELEDVGGDTVNHQRNSQLPFSDFSAREAKANWRRMSSIRFSRRVISL